eukprot:g21954.t1
MSKVIVGQDQVVEELLIALFSRGHCLLEGVPGLAKTLMISTLARCLSMTFARIQFTPDLMPADITGTDVLQENRDTGEREFRFIQGPLFHNVVLADEINRTPPKTQAALLEAMQERQVTVGQTRHMLSDPFFVLATQNPIEQEGTYPLPEAQQDRFMFKVFVDYPSFDEEKQIAKTTTTVQVDDIKPVLSGKEILELQKIVRQVPVTDHVVEYALALVRQTRIREAGAPEFVKEWLSWGAGPRAVQNLLLGGKTRALLEGRSHVSTDDIAALAKPVLRHRIVTNFTAESEGITPDDVITRLALSRISRLEVKARHIVEGFLSGLHRSPYFGQSVEFVQHREYVQGDDIRRIDWKVWSKTDKYYIKQFEEDTNLRTNLVVDLSESMLFGSGAETKYEYACTIAASLAYLLLRQQDSVGLVAFDDQVRMQLPPRSKQNHLHAILAALDSEDPQQKTSMYKILHQVAERERRKGMVVIISDLFVDRESLFRGLKLLRHRGHDVLILHVMDDQEIDFEYSGTTKFEGMEEMGDLICDPRSLRDGYKAAAQQKNRRRILIEQLLLLLLRILIVLAIMLLIARLILSRSILSLLQGTAQSHHLVLIDDSGSMQEISGQKGENAFEKAKLLVQKLAARGASEPGTQKFTVLLLSAPNRSLFLEQDANTDFVKQVVEKLRNVECSHQQFDLAEGMRIAGDTLTQKKENTTVIKHLHVISDFRQEDWKDRQPIIDTVESLTGKDISVNMIRAVEKALPNLAITDLSGDLQVATAKIPVRLKATVTNYGTAAVKNISMRIVVDGQALSRVVLFESIEPGPENAETRYFYVTFSTPGSHRLRVQLPADSMMSDNVRYLAIESLPRLNKVLLIDGNANVGEALDVRDALSANSQITGVEVQTQKPEWLRNNALDSFKCIYFLNVSELPADAIAPVETYVKNGGGIVWYLGGSINNEFYNTKLYRTESVAGSAGSSVERVTGLFPVPLANQSETLNEEPGAKAADDVQIQGNHPIFQVLAEADAVQLLKIKRYWPVATEPVGEKELTWKLDDNVRKDGVSTVASLRNRRPLMLEHALGKGRIITCLSTAGSEWATWGPDYVYTPLQLGLLQHVSRQTADKQRTVGVPILERVPAALYELGVEVGSPELSGTMTPLNAKTVTVENPDAEGGTEDFHEVTIGETDKPGIYPIRFKPKKGAVTGADGSSDLRMYAYNTPVEESAVALIPTAEMKSAFTGIEGVNVYEYEDNAPFEGKVPGADVRSWLLVLLVVLLLAEHMCSGMNLLESFTPAVLAKFTLDWPTGGWDWALVAGIVVAVVLAIVMYVYDARRLSPIAMLWMMFLRLCVFAGLAMIFLNPHDRTVKSDVSHSQVVVLIDRSMSMNLKEHSRANGNAPDSAASKRKRFEAVGALLADSPMIEQLRRNHDVSIYTFNSRLEGDARRFTQVSTGDVGAAKKEDDTPENEKPPTDWKQYLDPHRQSDFAAAPKADDAEPDAAKPQDDKAAQAKNDPKGLGSPNETRLGEVLRELMREKMGKTLSAVVVITDGQSNIGLDPVVAHAFARANKVRLFTVGVGGLERPVNARLMSVRSPTDVNKDNPYDITAVIQGTGMKDRAVNVQLFVKPENAPDTELTEVQNASTEKSVVLGGDNETSELTFNIDPKETGSFEYVVKITPAVAVEEFRTEDNELRRRVNVVERNLGVLLVAGGPMREYRFARNMLFRHQGINVDVWLQSADPGKINQISQDCDDLLTEFPKNFPTRPIVDSGDAEPDPKRAVQYDVVVAFDPDWTHRGFHADSISKLEDWVSKNSGGLIAVAGDVNTPELAAAANNPLVKPVLSMYPVTLSQLVDFDNDLNQKPQAWKIQPTEEGRTVKFLQLGETEAESEEVWKEFEGFYRCYPTTGRKAGATVYSYFSDPTLNIGDFGAPILLASQFYGVGRVLYLGSAEMWRLRSIDEDYFDRFWVKIVWEAGLGRMNRKSAYGTVMLEREVYYLGQSVRVLAHLQDIKNQPVRVPSVKMELIDPNGKFVAPVPKLLPLEDQPGYYSGYFQAAVKGTYRLKVENPAVEQEPGIPATVVVKLSDRETLDPRQDAKLLTDLARDTGGRYVPLSDFHQMFATVAEKRAVAEKEMTNDPESPVAKKAATALEKAEVEIERMFPNRSDLRDVLANLKSKIRLYVCIEGLALLLFVAGLLFWISFSIDWFWYWFSKWLLQAHVSQYELSRWFRIGFDLVAVAILFAAAWYWIGLRPFQSMRSKALALVLERRFPALNDRIVTSVELAESVSGQESPLTVSMLNRTVESASKDASRIRVSEVFETKPVKWAVIGALVAVISVASYGIVNAEDLGRWARAYLGLDADYWKRETDLRLQVITPPNERIREFKTVEEDGKTRLVFTHPRGGDLTLLVSVSKGNNFKGNPYVVPETVEIVYQLTSGDGKSAGVKTAKCTKIGKRKFKYSFGQVVNSMKLWVIGGDFKNRVPYEVVLVDPPETVKMSLDCDFPAYTGMNNDASVESRVEVRGKDVSVPLETRFLFRVDTNKKLYDAALEFGRYRLQFGEVPVSVSTDETSGVVEYKREFRANLRSKGLDDVEAGLLNAAVGVGFTDEVKNREFTFPIPAETAKRFFREDKKGFDLPFIVSDRATNAARALFERRHQGGEFFAVPGREEGTLMDLGMPFVMSPGADIRIYLEDTDEIGSTDPGKVTINVNRDKPPEIRDLIRKGIGIAVTVNAEIPIGAEINDDYGIVDASFEYRLAVSDKAAPGPWRVWNFDNEPDKNNPPKKFQLKRTDLQGQEELAERFPVSQVQIVDPALKDNVGGPLRDLKPGDIITLSVVATDADNLNGPHKTRSVPLLTFRVVTDDELFFLLRQKENGIRTQFEKIIEEVQGLRNELEDRLKLIAELRELQKAGPEDGKTEEFRKKVTGLQQRIRLTAGRAKAQIVENRNETLGVQSGFEDIRAELVNNKLFTEQQAKRIETDIINVLIGINKDDYPLVQDAIDLYNKNVNKVDLSAKVTQYPVDDIQLCLDRTDAMLLHMKAALDRMLQQAVELRYRRLQDAMQTLVQNLAKRDPRKAALLRQAIGRSQEERIGNRMNQVIELLKSKEFSDAVEGQGDVIIKLQALLELLQSEDRLDELRAEQKRIQDLLKDLNKLINKEKVIRFQTERGQLDPSVLAKIQKDIADKTKELKEKIDRQDAAKNAKSKANKPNDGKSKDGKSKDGKSKDGKSKDGKSKDGKSKDGKSKDGKSKDGKSKDGKSKDGKPKDGKSKDGKPKDGKSKDGKPKDGKPKDGKPKDGMPKDGKPSDGMPKDGKPKDGKPKDGMPKNGKPKPGMPNDSDPPDSKPKDGKQKPQQPQNPEDQQKTPGRDEIAKAEEAMRRAIEKLKKAEKEGASKDQSDALEQLEIAQQKLEEILKQLREEERKLLLRALAARFKNMLKMQKVILNGTIALNTTPHAQWKSNQVARSRGLSTEESKLVVEADKALVLLKAEGSSIAFPEAVEQIREDMLIVTRMLAKENAGKDNQLIQRDIIDALEEMIDALKKELEDKPPEDKPPGPPKDGKPQDPFDNQTGMRRSGFAPTSAFPFPDERDFPLVRHDQSTGEGRMVAATLLMFAAATAPQVEAVTLQGQKHTGMLQQLNAETATLQSKTGAVKLPVPELMTVSFPKAAAPKTDAKSLITVSLIDGSRFQCKQFTTTLREAKIESDLYGKFSIPLNHVAHVRFAPPSATLDPKWDELCQRKNKKDYLVIPKPPSLSHLDGVVGPISSQKVKFTLGSNVVPVDRSRVFGVIYLRDAAVQPSRKAVCQADMAGGDSLQLASVEWDGTKIEARLRGGATIELPLTSLKTLDFSLGKVKYLSAMEPREVKFTTFYNDPLENLLFHYRKDRALLHGHQLQLAKKKYSRGLWIHSRTQLKYRLGKDYRSFRAVMGIDDNAGGVGDVHVVITGDGKTLLETDVRTGDAPRELNIDAVDPEVIAAQKRRVAVVEKVATSVVAIFAKGGRGGGSGVLISPDGYALTNFHVTRGAGNFMKCGLNDGKLYDAVIVGIDPTGDVAMIKMLGRNDFPHATLGDSDKLKQGDWAFAMGNPFLLATDFKPTVTYGIISGVHRYQYPAGKNLLEYTDCIQIDTSINPGNSGGPLFNEAGELVGINGRGSFEKRGRVNSGAGYAISINQIKHFMGHLHSGRIVDHATLGATVATRRDGAVVVTNILEESEAYRRGLKIDDEIVSFAGRSIRSVNQYKNILGIYPKGWKLPLVYRRDNKSTKIYVRLRALHRASDFTAPPKKEPPKKKKKGKRPKIPLPKRPTPPAAKPPAKYKHMFVKRSGYANYYFNQQEQIRTLKGMKEFGDFSNSAGTWRLSGKTKAGKPFTLFLANDKVALELDKQPYVQLFNREFEDSPKDTGGLLVALHTLKEFLTHSANRDGFPVLYYLGTEPLDGRSELVDVIATEHISPSGGSKAIGRWYFSTKDGTFRGFDTTRDDLSGAEYDECQIRFHAFREFDGKRIPSEISIRHAEKDFATLIVEQAEFGAGQSIKAALPKVVKIFGAGGIKKLHEYGTGLIISPEGHVITVWNHVLDTDDILVVLNDGRKYKAKVLGAEPQLDLAVLKLEGLQLKLPYFDLKKDSGNASAGTRVLAFSNMFKVATGDEPVSVLHGVVAAKTKLSARRGVFEVPYDGTVYVVDAITNNPGAGGGLLMTYDGKLLGMLGRELRNTKTNTWINYAVPMKELTDTIDQIKSGNFVAREKKPDAKDNPNRYNPLDFGLVMVPDVVARTPAYVDSVIRGSHAAKAKLQPDDLVLFVNDELVHSSRMLKDLLGRLEAGDDLTMIVRRGTKLITVTFPVFRMNTRPITRRNLLVACCLFAVLPAASAAAADRKLEALEEKAFKQATALASPSIVRIQTVGGLDLVGKVLTGTGPTTGVIVSEDGYIISSAFNFISKPASILVQLPDGRRLTAKEIASDHSKMLTLLKVDAKNLTPAQPAPKNSIKVGQWAIALGRTFDSPLPSVSIGIVSALDRIWGRAIQTDAKVSPVNYGGPLVAIDGKVQGILVPLSTRGKGETAGVEWYDSGIGFAVPMEDVLAAVTRLKTGNDLHPGLMGISFKGAGLLGGEPVIDRVRSGSPAAGAGFRAGDRIVELDGRKIQRQAGVQHTLGKKYAGDTISMTVTRNGKSIQKKVTLVEKLVAYESAFLGIVPMRESAAAATVGVGVQYVYTDSPAEKAKLKPQDRIVKFNGKDIADAAMLLDAVSRLRPKTKATIGFLRGEKEMNATVELTSIPNTIPTELRPAPIPPTEKAGKKTGHFTVKMPKHEAEYWAYVPRDYNPAYKYGLMIWLHPAGDTMEASLVKKWKLLCDRWNIIIIAPKGAKLGGWTPNEAEFVKDSVDNLTDDYSVDPSRVFVHSFGDAGTFAFQVAFKYRELIRGVCPVGAALRTRPVENNPEFRLQFHFVCGEKDPLSRPVQAAVAGLRKLKFPVSSTIVKNKEHEYPDGPTLDEIARWADCLDRI